MQQPSPVITRAATKFACWANRCTPSRAKRRPGQRRPSERNPQCEIAAGNAQVIRLTIGRVKRPCRKAFEPIFGDSVAPADCELHPGNDFVVGCGAIAGRLAKALSNGAVESTTTTIYFIHKVNTIY